MLGKMCAGPSGGAGSGSLSGYLVGYAVAGKGASADEIRAAVDAVELEAESREDLGAGRIWSPEAGHGSRPSSILVRNSDSYSTFAMECDADGRGVVAHSALHFVWSWPTGQSGTMTDEQVLQYAQEAMEKIGLGEHRALLVVHRDTLVRDAHGRVIDGNLHVHAAVGAVHPTTGLAYETRGIYRRLAHADREVEAAHRLEPGRGLYVHREWGQPGEHIEEATKEELIAWGRERKEERLVAMERRSFAGYRQRDTTFDRYADATVGPRLQVAMDLARQRGREPDWATLHGVAARYGTAIQIDKDGRVILRDVGVGELRIAHDRARRSERTRMSDAGAEPDEIDARLAAMKAEHERAEADERERKIAEGEIVAFDSVVHDDRSDMPGFESVEGAENSLVAQVEQHPGMVLQDITAQSSTFTRDDVDRWLAARISDPETMERLGDLVVAHESVRALEADARYPLLTTTEILEVESRLHADAVELAKHSSGFTGAQIDAAMDAYEKKQSTPHRAFRLSEEQRAALHLLERGNLIAIEGLPGVGKTTIMSAVRELAEDRGKQIVGLTLSQAAAERLEDEAGFQCVNTARARILEEKNEPIIPRNGIVVVDEAGMVDSRAMGRILELAKERRSVVVAIGDTRQLQPIDFGASYRIVREVAKQSDAYDELRNVQRQSRDWHKEAVVLMSDAVVERDDAKRLELVTKSLNLLDDNGAITWTSTRDDAIDHAVKSARAFRAVGFTDTLLLAGDKDSVRHLSEEDRRTAGREGEGRTYLTAGGRREIASGDRFVFLENSLVGKRALGVRNGDTGTVVATEPSRISVALDRDDGRIVTFSTRQYQAWDHGNAITIHKSQGASVGATVPLMDRSTSAELVFVAMTRSKHGLDLVVPRTAYESRDDLARHISERISLKTTTRNYEEILEATGGKETRWAQKVLRAREAVDSPLRRQWQAEVVEPLRAQRQERMAEARDAYAEEKRGRRDGTLEERLTADRAALSRFKAAAQEIHAVTKPPSFSIWLREQEREQELALEKSRLRSGERQKHRDLENSRKIGREHTEKSHGTRRDSGIERSR